MDKIQVWHIIAACAGIYICGLTPGLSLNGDDSTYILISRSFLEKGVFHQIFLSSDLAKSTYYYCMLPLLLVPFQLCAPYNYLLMKTLPLVSAVASVILLSELLKGTIPDRWRKIVVLLFAINPWVAQYSGMILTEMPYLFFLLGSMVLFKNYDRSRHIGLLTASTLLAGASLFTRPFGVAACAAIVTMLALRRRFKACLFAICIIIIMGIPILINARTLSSSFADNFMKKQDYYAYQKKDLSAGSIIYRSGRTMLVYICNYLPDIVAGPAVSWIEPRLADRSINPVFLIKCALGVALAGLIFYGFIITARGGISVYHIYVIFHGILNLIINVYVARYLVSMIPFIILFLVAGVASAGRKTTLSKDGITGYAMTRSGVFCVVLLFVISLAGSCRYIADARSGSFSAEERSFIECSDWVKRNTPPDAVVLSRKPSYTKLETQRTAVGYFFIDDPAAQRALIVDNHVDIIIVGDLGFYLHEADYIIKTIQKYPAMFRLLYTSRNKPENYVYEVIKPQGRGQ